ncbi:MAG: UPF0175 family protein [Bryobacteraceae bacterium]
MPAIETRITLTLRQDIAAHLTAQGENLSHFALEALALGAYREHSLSTGQLRRLLGYRTRIQVDAFLKDHGVFLHYSSGDLEHDHHGGTPFRHHRPHD